MNKQIPNLQKTRQRRRPNTATLIVLSLLTVTFITACVVNQSAITRVVSALQDDHAPLPATTVSELDRFADVYEVYSDDATNTDRLEYFNFAFRRVRASYVNEVDEAALISAAIDGVTEKSPAPSSVAPEMLVEDGLHKMLKALDPHSSYLNADEFRETFANTKGEFGGLGIQVTVEGDFVKVIAPIEDTPASKAGVLAGDLITEVDGTSLEGKSLRDAVRLMRGRPGQPVDLKIRRVDVDDFDLRLVRAIIEVKAVRHRVEGNIGYVRITRFNEKTKSGVQEAMADIRNDLGNDLKGIVVDLRNNPGGLLNQSVVVADSFLNDGKIVSIKGRDGRDARSYYAEPGDLARGVPVIVLVNRGSASASEIVASALQYHDRAIIMGTQTFGKGSVQTIMPLPLEGALRLTTALYYRPDNVAIQAVGVTPDIIIDRDLTPQEPGSERREADLPGAIPAEDGLARVDRPHVSETACPGVGEADDHLLGCALEYIKLNNEQAFINRYASAG